ncbi:hypothetical protein ANCCAN_15998 [Ancylostoma caninum]|uniref:Regulator of condensation n=1 Tax=Ancylostoma caninum TaxID=29170 RepID=A0A368G552_ANCCA|nr:hypothetical protein ANCCAN_15998 [Ancylostoma caninum]
MAGQRPKRISQHLTLFNEFNFWESGVVRPVVVQNPEDVRIIMAASGNDHSLFLTDRGAVFALGTGSNKGILEISEETGFVFFSERLNFGTTETVSFI